MNKICMYVYVLMHIDITVCNLIKTNHEMLFIRCISQIWPYSPVE